MQETGSFLQQPWPWYIAGPLIGLMVPLLLILGNKAFGISSSLRHFCAACIPSNIPFFKYDWRRESWNLFLVTGIILGAAIAATLWTSPGGADVAPALREEMKSFEISVSERFLPAEVFSFDNLLSLQGFLIMVVGGFLVGFGTRYAGGCTSGHSIMGLSTLQFPSLIATICFMIGGFLTANLLLPVILAM